MEYRHEIINFGESIPVKCFIHQLGHATRHWHGSMELLFVLSGRVTVSVDGDSYALEKDDVILVNANTPHELSADAAILTAVQIKLSLFDDKPQNINELYFDCNSKKDPGNPGIPRIKRIVAEFVKTYAVSGEARIYRARSLCYALLAELIDCFQSEKKAKNTAQTDYQYDRIARIVQYINEHYYENLSLQLIAEQEFLSVPYLSKFFQRMMGVGFAAYLSQLRLSQAVSHLAATNDTIETIAQQHGFPNTQSFVQQFKKRYGVLPSQWRRQHSDEPSGARHAATFNDYTILDTHEYLNYFAAYLSHGEPAETMIAEPMLPDITSHYTITTDGCHRKLKNTWKTFTAVGSAAELLQADVQKMLAELQRAVGFSYIKFHGILSDDMSVVSRDKHGELQFSFVYVDRALDFLLSIGLKPLVQLSFMPAAIARVPGHRIFDSTMINSPPTTNAVWCDLVRRFLEHLQLRYGAREMESWLYTVWNEPDTPNNMFGFEKDEDFYRFYQQTYRVLRAVNGNLKIGSPSTYFDPSDTGVWMRRFTSWCAENECRSDFVIFHSYGTIIAREEVGAKKDVSMDRIQLTTDENMLTKSIEMIRGYVDKAYAADTPVYLTEWNYAPSHRELLGDTCFRSCYMVKNILENYDRLGGMGYWLLTDLFGEHQVPDETFHGGLGLYTYNGIRKPAWYAYWLLAKLGDELIESGDGYFLTRRGDAYQLMLYHYKHYSDLYAACETFDMTLTNRYTPFGPDQRRDFEIRLPDMPAGRWHVLEYTLNRQSGSAFDKWVEMGAQPVESEEEVELLKSLSRPMMNKYTLQAGDRGLMIHSLLEPLEVRLILLQRS